MSDPDEPVRRWRLGRELIVFAAALVVGLVLVPILIWVAGHYTLGAYAHGGPWALLQDYVKGLAQGFPIFWAVAIGPYLIVQLVRLVYFLVRPRS